MIYWILLSNLGQVRIGEHNEEHLAKIFLDTGANCNTISRTISQSLVDQALKRAFSSDPSKVLSINLVGGHTQHLTGE